MTVAIFLEFPSVNMWVGMFGAAMKPLCRAPLLSLLIGKPYSPSLVAIGGDPRQDAPHLRHRSLFPCCGWVIKEAVQRGEEIPGQEGCGEMFPHEERCQAFLSATGDHCEPVHQ